MQLKDNQLTIANRIVFQARMSFPLRAGLPILCFKVTMQLLNGILTEISSYSKFPISLDFISEKSVNIKTSS